MHLLFRSHLNADMELAIDIVWHFGPEVVLATMEKVYTYLTQLQIYESKYLPCFAILNLRTQNSVNSRCALAEGLTDDEFKVRRLSQSADSKAVMDLSRKDSLRDVEIVVYYTLELVMKICAKVREFDSV